jgi:two-component system, LytTR family, response regulator
MTHVAALPDSASAVVQAPIRALLVDDDPLARERVRNLLARYDDIEVIAECRDGREAVEALSTIESDLVFLDVQMPLLDGFGVLESVGAKRMPPVIFTSAYSEFAVRAFEAYALDYLLKPFDDARFDTALQRARPQVDARRRASTADPHTALDARIIGLLEHLQQPQRPRYPEAIAIKSGGQYVVVRVADIDWIEADGNYARLYVQQRPRLITKTLATLAEDVLDPDIFVRVHRSFIVNTARITAVEPLFHGELTLVLRDGTHVPCSRRYRKQLEGKLYFTS